MARKAVIADGVVENIIIADDSFTLPGKALVTAPAVVSIGWRYDGETFSTPEPEPPPVPLAVSPLQARKALRAAGLKGAVDAFLDTLPEDQQEEWEYAIEIERTHPTVLAAAGAMGMTAEQLDDLFRLAATL